MSALVPRSARHVARLAVAAREMRRAATFSEQILWRELSGGKLGVSFRRQVVIGGRAIVDFAAPAVTRHRRPAC